MRELGNCDAYYLSDEGAPNEKRAAKEPNVDEPNARARTKT